MKKIFLILIAGSLISARVFAVDLSYDTGEDKSTKRDMSMGVKNTNDKKKSKRKFKSKIDSAAYSTDVVYDPTASYLQVAQNDELNSLLNRRQK